MSAVTLRDIVAVRKYMAICRKTRVQCPAAAWFFVFATASKSSLRPTQSPVHWVSDLSPVVERPESEAVTRLHPVPTLRTHGD
jgi:hypothetical protein